MNKRFKLSEDIHKGIKGRYPLGSPLHQHTVPAKVAYHPLTLLVQPKCIHMMYGVLPRLKNDINRSVWVNFLRDNKQYTISNNSQ